MDSVLRELKEKYDEMKVEVLKPITKDDRTKHLLTMLVKIINTATPQKKLLAHKRLNIPKHISDGLVYFHPIENGFQLPFEELLFDPRFEEGKIIQKWRNLMGKQGSNATITAISTFAFKLTNSLLKSCDITESQPYWEKRFFDATHLLCCRALFPRITDIFQTIQSKFEAPLANDEIYSKRLKWMRRLTMDDIGIPEKFQPPPNSVAKPYPRAIASFMDVHSTWVPQDNMVALIDAVNKIQKCGLAYCEKGGKGKEEITGDDLFPIVVWCVVNSRVKTWHAWIYRMEKFYHKNILSFGQSGFCFSLLRACVAFVMQQTPEKFHSS